ncbi:AraC family transcriptional regulator [Pontibacter ummariensis]|uniref:Transcriptional regulator, AraC family n=1 Tax=Pontibacter ummariensis TaxID=1610492 RepID=A0A239FEV6_9BACT|nr:AraC family transcriptional regulator [Pontibacter ummariensis]PRY12291.1 AraC family transcriptional regulator [Pontibacter ummariensis]SNS55295.1 transcriptional regulator, AraC family [Pontibacter ummariensis]
MKITSKVDAVNEWICHEELSTTYDNCCAPSEKEVVLKGPAIASLQSFQISAKGLFIINTEMVFNRPVCDRFEVTDESIIMGFYLEGDASAEVTGLLPESVSPPNIHYICYTPSFKAEFRMPPHKLHHYFLIILSREFYFRLLHQQSGLHQEFANRVVQGQHSYLNQEPMEITPEIKWVLNDIRNSQRKGPLKRLYLEAKVLELLMLQLEQWQQLQEQRTGMNLLKRDDAIRITEAKAILDKNFHNPPTIQELARQVCLNEYKLKQGFKASFHHTVHGYVVWLRMEQAKQLLKQQQYSISEIAYRIGYKSSAHFTAAFKKHFGFLPSQIKGQFGE